MKTAEAKKSASTARQNKSFFNKEGNQSFFGQNSADTSFFSKSTTQAFIQPKLTVGQPGDNYEQEADAMADTVVQRLSQPEVQKSTAVEKGSPITPVAPAIQTKCAACEQEEKLQRKEENELLDDQLQRKPIFESIAPPPEEDIQRKCAECEAEGRLQQQHYAVKIQKKTQHEVKVGDPHDSYETEADNVAKSIVGNSFVPSVQRKGSNSVENEADIKESALSAGGHPLGSQVQGFFENKMGYDFSEVRVHTGEEAVQKSEALNAHAFTYGNHIWLNEGQKAEPSFIMAHEMAHVVQQTQPSSLQKKSKITNHEGNSITNIQTRRVQRFIFWNEYLAGGRTNRKGQDTHHELEKAFVKGSGIQAETWIPNGNSSGVGFGFDGRPDLYKSTNVIGVTFRSPDAGTPVCSNGESLGKPGSLNAKQTAKKPNFSKSGNITQINSAPSEITVGDIKPAESSVVAAGKNQVSNYVGGLEFARDQVNCWSDNNPPSKGSSPQWGLSTPKKFDDSSLPIPNEYNSPTSGKDRNLGISSFNMVSDEANLKPKTEKIFSPHDLGITINGKLLVLHAGEGVVVYYYQPTDLLGVIKSLGLDPRAKEFKAYAEFATQLQNMVITPLLSGPKTAKKTKGKQVPGSSNQSPSPDAAKGLQLNHKKEVRAKKKVKMEDDFKLGTWKSQHQEHQNNFKHKNESTRDKLQFAGLLYETEANLKNAGAPDPAAPLPPKSQFDIIIGKSPDGKDQTKNLTSLYGWMNIWAKEPVKYLGTFRSKFGKSFVTIGNKFNSLKAKLDDKMQNAKKTNTPTGKGYGDIAVRAFWRALVKVGGLVFEDTIRLLVLSLESGLKNKMAELIPIEGKELEEMVEKGFPELKNIQDTIERLENDFDKKVDEVVAQFDVQIADMKKAADRAKTYGKIIKWAMVAIQCGSPPGWGCLKLLAKRLIAELIDQILEWCWTQKKFSGLVLSTGVFDNIPKVLGEGVADVVEGAVPGISPIFDRKVFDQAVRPSPDDISCEKEPTEEHKAMVELHEELEAKLGPEGYLLFLEAMDKYGVKSNEEFSPDQIREIKNQIPDNVTADELMQFIASNPRPKHNEGMVLNIAEFLKYVKSSQAPNDFTWYYVAHPPKKGHTKGERVQVKVTISPYRPHTHWSVIKQLEFGAKVDNRDWYNKEFFQINYKALQDVNFELGSNQEQISEGTIFPGYRPDPFL